LFNNLKKSDYMTKKFEQKIEAHYRKIKYKEGILPLSLLTPDIAQPRKKYDPENLEDLKLGVKDGLLSKIVVEEMNYSRYRDYINTYFNDCLLRQKYLQRAEANPTQKQYIIVIGHLRWLATMAAGYPAVPVKITKNLSLEERRDIQIQEDSQLPFKKWAKAEAISRYYIRKKAELAEEGLDYAIVELSAHVGKSEKAVREMLKYATNLDQRVKAIIREDKLSYEKGVIIARLLDKEQQFRIAINEAQYMSVKALSDYITGIESSKKQSGASLLQETPTINNNNKGKVSICKKLF
jgi:ParB-like chromosome segregation protein Spo0J